MNPNERNPCDRTSFVPRSRKSKTPPRQPLEQPEWSRHIKAYYDQAASGPIRIPSSVMEDLARAAKKEDPSRK
jgi:RNA polymerase-interacting CarD/CdnL/TRCF family regulator